MRDRLCNSPPRSPSARDRGHPQLDRIPTETVATRQGLLVHNQGPGYIVTPGGVVIPTDPDELQNALQNLTDTSTNPATSRKFVGEDSNGPMRVRIEQGHPEDPTFTGPEDPLHTVDHMHIDRRENGLTGKWGSEEKIPCSWPF